MGLSVWRETSKKLTVYRVCYTPIETLLTEQTNIRLYPPTNLTNNTTTEITLTIHGSKRTNH